MEKTTIEEIKKYYALVPVKNELHAQIAEHFKIEPISVKTNWFNGFSIPKGKQTKVLEIIKTLINK